MPPLAETLLPDSTMKPTFFAMVVLTVLGACSRHDDEITVTSAKVASTMTPRERDAQDAAQRWNAAMSQRDLTLLAAVYGANVVFYGVPLRHDQVLQVLSDAFVKDPSFTQSITDVRMPAADRIELKRTYVVTGKSRNDPAWLKLAREDGKLVVVEQGDPTSDARLDARPRAKEEYCEGLAQRVVLSTDKARALVGHANEVHVVFAPPMWPAYVVTVLDKTQTRPVAIGWFDVVPQTGEVSDAFGGETLKPNGDLVAQLRNCPK
jgi:hypothetical protein